MMLLAEQHTGRAFNNEEEAQKYIEMHLGIFMGVMAAACEGKVNIIKVLHEVRNKWLKESISILSTTN